MGILISHYKDHLLIWGGVCPNRGQDSPQLRGFSEDPDELPLVSRSTGIWFQEFPSTSWLGNVKNLVQPVRYIHP